MVIKEAKLDIIATRRSQYPEGDKPEFLLVGRSNVGKSSFINAILSRKNLAYTSAKPGKTQTLNFYGVNDSFYLIDVPGYGYAAVSNKKQEKFGLMIEEYIMNRPNLKHVFLLVDYRHRPTENDLMMYDFLKYYNLSVTIVCTKYDKVSKNSHEKLLNQISKTLEMPKEDLILFSSVTKTGKQEVYNKLINSLELNR